jgi:transposase
MGKRKELSVEERSEIIYLRRTGMTMREIGRKVGCSASCVCKTLQRYSECYSLQARPRSGRPNVMTRKDQRYAMITVKRDRFKTIPILQEEMLCGKNKKETVSQSTLRKALKKYQLNGRVAAKKPFLRKPNIAKRLAFAKEHVNWSEADWGRVLFTDESKFEFFGNKRRTFVRRFPNERFQKYCLKPTVKHGGGNVMVWGGISVRGVSRLKLIVGKMDAAAYKKILQHNVIPDGKKLLGKGFILQQDNDPKHAANIVKRYLNSKEIDGDKLLNTI